MPSEGWVAEMLRITLPTDQFIDSDHAGTDIANVLRALADDIESKISIAPADKSYSEWTTETRRFGNVTYSLYNKEN